MMAEAWLIAMIVLIATKAAINLYQIWSK